MPQESSFKAASGAFPSLAPTTTGIDAPSGPDETLMELIETFESRLGHQKYHSVKHGATKLVSEPRSLQARSTKKPMRKSRSEDCPRPPAGKLRY